MTLTKDFEAYILLLCGPDQTIESIIKNKPLLQNLALNYIADRLKKESSNDITLSSPSKDINSYCFTADEKQGT